MPPVMIRESCRVRYDSDALAYFRMCDQMGQPVDFSQKKAVDGFIKTMKEDGIWDKMSEVYAFQISKAPLKGDSKFITGDWS